MQRISSRMTFFYKRVFPFFFFGVFLLAFAANFIGSAVGKGPPLLFFIMPLIVAVFAFFLLKALIFDLVDEVLDDGDALVIRNGGDEYRVNLADIKNVSYSVMISPPRVVLSLRSSGPLGAKVAFMPPIRFIPFATSPVIDALIERIDMQRRH
ncbi:MAG TPA: hypothetical protein VN229_03785 [Terriglobales bacterium]|nr:hypothetical protein [Terriglobales bacterium]